MIIRTSKYISNGKQKDREYSAMRLVPHQIRSRTHKGIPMGIFIPQSNVHQFTQFRTVSFFIFCE